MKQTFSACHGSCPRMIHSHGASHGRLSGPSITVPSLGKCLDLQLDTGIHQFLLRLTLTACAQRTNIHVCNIFRSICGIREQFPQAISVPIPQTTVLILDKPPQNTSAVTLPNWEIISFPTADLMNDPLGEPTLLLHLLRRPFNSFRCFSPERDNSWSISS